MIHCLAFRILNSYQLSIQRGHVARDIIEKFSLSLSLSAIIGSIFIVLRKPEHRRNTVYGNVNEDCFGSPLDRGIRWSV